MKCELTFIVSYQHSKHLNHFIINKFGVSPTQSSHIQVKHNHFKINKNLRNSYEIWGPINKIKRKNIWELLWVIIKNIFGWIIKLSDYWRQWDLKLSDKLSFGVIKNVFLKNFLCEIMLQNLREWIMRKVFGLLKSIIERKCESSAEVNKWKILRMFI